MNRSEANPLRFDLDHILAHTPGVWDALRGQRIFITGGTGFFGTWLLESFAHANDTLNLQAHAVVLTRNPTAFSKKAPHLGARRDLTLVPGDVRDFQFPEGPFPFVIHAGTTSSAPVEPREMFDTIVGGTRRVLDFAATHETRQLLFVSSGGCYGRQPPELTHLPETYAGGPDPLDPNSAYGEGKRAAELLCAMAGKQSRIDIKIARCFAFVGPHLPLDAHFAIGNFIRDAMRGGPIHVGGDGTPYRSYLYAADLAIWLWTILFRGTSARAYNVGSPDALTIRQIAEATATALELSTGVRVAKLPTPGQPASRYVPDVQRARTELGLEAWIDLPTSIKKTVHWSKNCVLPNLPNL